MRTIPFTVERNSNHPSRQRHIRTPFVRKRLGAELLERRELLTGAPGWEFSVQGNIESTTFYGYDMEVGPDGSIYTHSSFSGTADLDPSGATYNLTATPSVGDLGDGVVARYSADRELLWARRFGGSGREYTRDIAVDSDGSAYIIGIYYTQSSADFGSIVLPASSSPSYDVFVAKVNHLGDFLWAKRVGGNGTENANEIDVLPDGSLGVAVSFEDTVDFDPGADSSPITSNGLADGAILRLDANGQFLSVQQFGGASNDSVHAVSHDALGNTYVAGVIQGTVDFGGAVGQFSSPGPSIYSGFLLKFDGTNTPVWGRSAASPVGVQNQRLAVGDTGDVYWSTSFFQSLDLGGGAATLTAMGSLDLAMSSWDPQGNLAWVSQIGGAGSASARDHMIDAQGQILIPGWFTGTIDFDPGIGATSRTSAGGEDAFLLTLDASGGLVSIHQAGGSLNDRAFSVDADLLGNVYWSGNFRQSAIMPSGETLVGSTYNDFFLSKIAPPAATKFFVVDSSADNTHEFDAFGNRTDRYGLATGSGNTAPRGAASNLAGDRVWVIDANRKVYVYDNAGGLLGSWTANGLTSTTGITTNGVDLWISDSSTDRVYKYTGAASRLGGSQSAASNFKLKSTNSNPTDLVTDGTSIWVVNDAAVDTIFKYTSAGVLQGSWTIDSRNAQPTGITINPGSISSIYVLDNGRDQVFEYVNGVTRTTGSQAGDIVTSIGPGNLDLQGLADPPKGNQAIARSLVSPIDAAFATYGQRHDDDSVRAKRKK